MKIIRNNSFRVLLFIVLILGLYLVGCGSDNEDESSSTSGPYAILDNAYADNVPVPKGAVGNLTVYHDGRYNYLCDEKYSLEETKEYVEHLKGMGYEFDIMLDNGKTYSAVVYKKGEYNINIACHNKTISIWISKG